MATSLGLETVIPDQVIDIDENGSDYLIEWNPKFDVLAIATDQGSLFFWNSMTNEMDYQFSSNFGDHIKMMCWNRNGTLLAAVVSTARIFVWDSKSSGITWVLNCNGWQNSEIIMSWNPEGNLLAFSSVQFSEAIVEIWDADDILSKTMNRPLSYTVTFMQWNKNGTLFLTSGKKGCIIWSPFKEEPQYKFDNDSLWNLLQVAWKSDTIFTVSRDNNSMVMFKVGNSQAIGTLNGHTGAIDKMKWDTHGELLASCAADKTVKVWSMRSKKCLPKWKDNCHIDNITEIKWLYNNIYGSKTLASFSLSEIKIWSITGSCLAIHLLEPRQLFHVSPSGGFFISAKKEKSNCKTFKTYLIILYMQSF